MNSRAVVDNLNEEPDGDHPGQQHHRGAKPSTPR
jgi:hypothetical protein